MDWNEILKTDPLPWLLETDSKNPGIRYFALKDLLGKDDQDPEVIESRQQIMASGPVPRILEGQDESGFWIKPGPGYSPKYKGTVWQNIFLADLGADPKNEKVRKGGEYLLSHSIDPDGAFSCNPRRKPSYSLSCLNGNLLYALQLLGFEDDPRVYTALQWMAVSVIDPQCTLPYCGYQYACLVNDNMPCAWGMIKALKAFSLLAIEKRSPEINQAIEMANSYLSQRKISEADYPPSDNISKHWFRLGFPLSYWSDFLENAAILAKFNALQPGQIQPIIDLLLSKRDQNGFWQLENTSLNNRMWGNPETRKRGSSSKWITLRVLQFLHNL